jgi:hypothetical protein
MAERLEYPIVMLGWHSSALSVPVPRAPSESHDIQVMSCSTPVESQFYAKVAGRCGGGSLGS